MVIKVQQIKVQDPRDIINDLDANGLDVNDLDVKDVNTLDVKDVIEVKTLLPQSKQIFAWCKNGGSLLWRFWCYNLAGRRTSS